MHSKFYILLVFRILPPPRSVFNYLLFVLTLGTFFFTPTEVKASETLYFVHQDHLGSTSLVTDTAGKPISKQTHFPYGATRSYSQLTTDNLQPERQYTGQVSDQDQTGLYYYNARYYNPQIAKFTQADSLNNKLNRYEYVVGNPIKRIDPTGNQSTNSNCDFWCWAKVAILDLADGRGAHVSAMTPIEVDNEFYSPEFQVGMYIGGYAGFTAFGLGEVWDIVTCVASPDPTCAVTAALPGPNPSRIEFGNLKVRLNKYDIYSEGIAVQNKVSEWIDQATKMSRRKDELSILKRLNSIIYEGVEYDLTFTERMRKSGMGDLEFFAACNKGVCSQKAQLMFATMRKMGLDPELLIVGGMAGDETAYHAVVRYMDDINNVYFFDPTWNFVIQGNDAFQNTAKMWAEGGYNVNYVNNLIPKNRYGAR